MADRLPQVRLVSAMGLASMLIAAVPVRADDAVACRHKGDPETLRGGAYFDPTWLRNRICGAVEWAAPTGEPFDAWFLAGAPSAARNRATRDSYRLGEVEINGGTRRLIDTWIQVGHDPAQILEAQRLARYPDTAQLQQLKGFEMLCTGPGIALCEQGLRQLSAFHSGIGAEKRRGRSDRRLCLVSPSESSQAAAFMAGLGMQTQGDLRRMSTLLLAAKRASNAASHALGWPSEVPVFRPPPNTIPPRRTVALVPSAMPRFEGTLRQFYVRFGDDEYRLSAPLLWLFDSVATKSGITLGRRCAWRHHGWVDREIEEEWSVRLTYDNVWQRLTGWLSAIPLNAAEPVRLSRTNFAKLRTWEQLFRRNYAAELASALSSDGSPPALQLRRGYTIALTDNLAIGLVLRRFNLNVATVLQAYARGVEEGLERIRTRRGLAGLGLMALVAAAGPAYGPLCSATQLATALAPLTYRRERQSNRFAAAVQTLCENAGREIAFAMRFDDPKRVARFAEQAEVTVEGFLAIAFRQPSSNQIRIVRIALPDPVAELPVWEGILKQAVEAGPVMPAGLEAGLRHSRDTADEFLLATLGGAKNAKTPTPDEFLKSWLAEPTGFVKQFATKIRWAAVGATQTDDVTTTLSLVHYVGATAKGGPPLPRHIGRWQRFEDLLSAKTQDRFDRRDPVEQVAIYVSGRRNWLLVNRPTAESDVPTKLLIAYFCNGRCE